MQHFARKFAAVALVSVAASACVSVSSSIPMALVEFEISGSPRILPGGPDVHVDGVYRGKPIHSRFRMYLTEGEHHVLIQGYGGPDGILWDEDVLVVPSTGTQVIVIRYGE